MNTSSVPAWRRLDTCWVDGEPFVLETQAVTGGYRVRIQFDGKTPIEDPQVWPSVDEARGRALQLADDVVEQGLR